MLLKTSWNINQSPRWPSHRPGDVYRVVLGEHDMSSQEGTEQIRDVLRIIVHPKWDIDFVADGWVHFIFTKYIYNIYIYHMYSTLMVIKLWSECKLLFSVTFVCLPAMTWPCWNWTRAPSWRTVWGWRVSQRLVKCSPPGQPVTSPAGATFTVKCSLPSDCRFSG